MSKLICKDYGFDCNFETSDDVAKKAIDEFQKHTLQEHHINYSKEALSQFILRKNYKM